MESDLVCTDRAQCIVLGAGAYGIFGALVGMGIGAFIKSERWEEVPLDRLTVLPQVTLDGRLGLAASVRF